MMDSFKFLKLVLDSLGERIAVINRNGRILFVNDSWASFDGGNSTVGVQNVGDNYLEACDRAAAAGDDFGRSALNGIKSVISGESDEFYFDYACHEQDEKRWFLLRVTSFQHEDARCLVISHQDITERKQAEDEIQNLSRADGLTGLPNRRQFNEFLDNEWKRCARLQLPISLAMIDLDHFRSVNQDYGPAVGDECLKKVAFVLGFYARRPADLCARYSGEKFALVLSDTSAAQAKEVISGLNAEIQALKLPNRQLPPESVLTVSIGLASMQPDDNNRLSDLITKADMLLYVAKDNGRNRIAS